MAGAASSMSLSASPNRRCAGATSGEWNAQATGSRRARMSALRAPRDRRLDHLDRARQHRPARRVAVGGDDLARGQQRLELVGRGVGCRHRAGLVGRGGGHRAPAGLRELQFGLPVDLLDRAIEIFTRK